MAAFVIGLGLGLASSSAQAPQPGFPGGGLWKPPLSRSVPIQLADGLAIASGSLSRGRGDSGPLAFAVDTAATATVIDSGVALRLGWKAPAKGLYPGNTLELAGASVGNRPVFGLSLDGLARQAGVPVEGVVGADIFQNFAVTLNYAQHWMMLQMPESCATPAKKLAVRMLGGLPFVEASVAVPEGQPVQGLFLVDTGQSEMGSGAGLVLTAEFVAKHPELAAKATRLPAFDATGTARTADFLRIGTLMLGDQTLHGVVAAVAAPSPGGAELAGVIGAGVLRRFDLLVDLKGHFLVMTPNAEFTAPFEADMSGLLLLSGDATGRSGEPGGRPGEHMYMIAGIAERSPASEAGLQAGDRLTAIADRNVRAMTMEMIRGILKSGPGTKVMVGVDRSGKKMQVVLTLRRAI